MAQQHQNEQIEYLKIGNEFNKIRDEMNNKFVNLAQNMELQLADLKRQIAAEKQMQSQLQEAIKRSDEQRDEFKQECGKKTGDLKQINSFYTSNADDQSFNNLLNNIVERHQVFQQSLQRCNYNQNVGSMNKKWQDEIYKISQHIKASPDKAEFASILDELRNRTKELNTIKQIEDGNISYLAMNDLVDQCEERHAAQTGDKMSTYKCPGKIEDVDVLKNNEHWETLLNVLKDFIINNQKRLTERNDLYLQELSGRINDLSHFKNILNIDIKQQQNNKKMKKKEIKALKEVEARKQTKNLSLNIQQRHVQIENQVKNTMDMNQVKDKQQLQNLNNNDGAWRNEFDQNTKQMIDFLI